MYRPTRLTRFAIVLFGVGVSLIVCGSLFRSFLRHQPLDPNLTTAVGLLVSVAALLATLPPLLGHRENQTLVDISSILDIVGFNTQIREEAQHRELVPTAIELNVEFHQIKTVGRADTSPPHMGNITDAAAFYGKTRLGRMVIVGPGGSGKTVLLIRLAIDLLARRQPGGTVPIRLSLPRWDASMPFDEWVAHEFEYQNRVPFVVARRLVSAGMVLPLLDGLDEMDLDGSHRPGRAAEALRRLDSGQLRRTGRPGRVILACRDATYTYLMNGGEHLHDAVTVRLNSLSDRQIIAQLNSVVDDPSRWSDAVGTIEADPTGELAAELCLPWHLAIVIALYEERGDDGAYLRDPAELLRFNRGARGSGLVKLYAEALLDHPAMKSRTRDRASASRAFRAIASYLRRNTVEYQVIGDHPLPSVDIVPHELWPIAGLHVTRMVTAAICAILWLPGMGAAAWLLTARHLWLFPGVWLIATVSLLPIVSIVSSVSWWPHPRNIVLNRLRRPTAWKRLGAATGIAAVIGLASAGLGGGSFSFPFALSFLVSMGVSVALAVRDSVGIRPLLVGGAATGLILTPVAMAVLGFLGAAGGMLSGLAAGGLALIAATKLALRTSSAVPDYVRNPAVESYVRRDVRTGLVATALVSAVVLLTIMINPTLRASLPISVVASVSAGFSVGFGLVAETWRRYVAMLAVMRRRFPIRFNRLLMSAYRAGMLRRAGIAFQFRHLELRDYFGS